MKSVNKMLVYSGLIILVIISLSVFVTLVYKPDLPMFIWLRDFLAVNWLLLTVLGTVLLGLIKSIPRLVNYFNESEKQKIANRKRKEKYFQLGVKWARLHAKPQDNDERQQLKAMIAELNLAITNENSIETAPPSVWFPHEEDKNYFNIGKLVTFLFVLQHISNSPLNTDVILEEAKDKLTKANEELCILFKKEKLNLEIIDKYDAKLDKSFQMPNQNELANRALTELVEQLFHE